MRIIRNKTTSLTGRWRCRAGWFGRLVMQCEIRVTADAASSNPFEPIKRETITYWRDAGAEDLNSSAICRSAVAGETDGGSHNG